MYSYSFSFYCRAPLVLPDAQAAVKCSAERPDSSLAQLNCAICPIVLRDTGFYFYLVSAIWAIAAFKCFYDGPIFPC